MERLTRRSDAGHAYYPHCFEGPCNRRCEECLFDETICERLAAYEDSGREPEEVLPELIRLADLESICSYTRLRELAEADKEGRMPAVRALWAHLGGDEWCCSACGFVITTEGSWDKPTQKYCEDCGAEGYVTWAGVRRMLKEYNVEVELI